MIYSAESLSSNLISPKTEMMTTSLSVTTELNRVQESEAKIEEIAPKKVDQPPKPNSCQSRVSFQGRQRNTGMRQSKLVRQSKVEDHNR